MAEVDAKPAVCTSATIRRDRSTGHYYVSLDTWGFAKGNDANNLFIVWLYQRFSDETIHLSFKSSAGDFMRPAAFNTIANAIGNCPATVIAYVDHGLTGIESYITLEANKIVMRDFGMIQLSPITTEDNSSDLPAPLRAVADYFFNILDRAVSRGWVLPEERDRVLAGYWVNLNPFDLATRLM